MYSKDVSTSSDHSKYVIQGSGLPALFAAMMLVEEGMGSRTLMLERGDAPGGLLKSVRYKDYGVFDQGMHNLQETGRAEIDSLVFPLIPDENWNILVGNQRDLAGNIRGGKLNSGSVYIDVRTEGANGPKLVQSLLNHIESVDNPSPDDQTAPLSAREYLNNRFGAAAAIPYLERLEGKYGLPASDLSVLACRLTPMDRYVVFDEKETLSRYDQDHQRSVLAWPDQRTLPESFSSGKRSFYPKVGGMQAWVDAAIIFLKKNGVEIRTQSHVVGIRLSQQSVSAIEVSGPGGVYEVSCDLLLWSTGRKSLIESLVNVPGFAFGKGLGSPVSPMRTWLVHLALEGEIPALGDLHYVFDHSPTSLVHRVTNYNSFCPEIAPSGIQKLTIELLDPANAVFSEQAAVEEALRAIEAPLVIDKKSIVFARGVDLGKGYPLPSLSLNERARLEGEYLDNLCLTNVIPLGSKPESGVFFQGEILEDSWERITNWKN